MNLLEYKLKKILKRKIKEQIFHSMFLKSNSFFNSINFSPSELVFEDKDKCLLLAPHPDDESIGCGGILLKYPDKFDVICLTDGRYGDENKPINDIINERKKEFEAAVG